MDPLVLTTDRPTGRIAVDRATLARRPPYLVVRVREIVNDSGTPFSIRITLQWETADGASEGSAPVGTIVPYPADRADDQLFDASEAFGTLPAATETDEGFRAWVGFEVGPVSTERTLGSFEVTVGSIEWYEDSDFDSNA